MESSIYQQSMTSADGARQAYPQQPYAHYQQYQQSYPQPQPTYAQPEIAQPNSRQQAMQASVQYTGQTFGQQPMQPTIPMAPGLKMTYGAMAVNPVYYGFPLPQQVPQQSMVPRKSLFSRLKDNVLNTVINPVINAVTEEAEVERPIGISQLSRKTFTADESRAGQTIVRGGSRAMQDYRFNHLVDR